MTVNTRAMWLTIATLVLLWTGSAQAVTGEQRCQQAKLKAQGKLQLCLKKNSVKIIAGQPDASAACYAQFAERLTKADAAGLGGPCRYLDNGDGTVSDLNTGLMWEQKDSMDGALAFCPSAPSCANPHDADNVYRWSASGSIAADGSAFTDFLARLNNGTFDGTTLTGCFAGHCDWRLPTFAELETIVAAPFPCETSPCIDAIFGPTRSEYYWSSITVAGSTNFAWTMGFADAEVYSSYKTGNDFARAVRGGL